MKFRLNEDLLTDQEKELYEGWEQEDIDLYESIDWSDGAEEYDAGFAYLDSALLYGEEVIKIETEFHKFFKKDPYEKPYYRPVDKAPFNDTCNTYGYIGPEDNGDMHKNYKVLNKYNSVLTNSISGI